MPEVIDMARGVPQAYFIDEFAADGIMLEGIAGPPDYVAMGLPVAGERHRELMGDYRHLAQFGLMISDDTRGRVHSLGGRPVVRYDLSDTDNARVRPGSTARGAVPGRGRDVRAAAAGAQAHAFHPLGSARMDARPEPRRARREPARPRRRQRLRLRRQRGSLLARRQPPDHDHDPRDPIGPPPMSFLIDGPWLYANGRAIARATDNPHRSPPARWRCSGA